MFRVLVIDKCKKDFLKLKKEINWELLDVSEIALAEDYDDIKSSVKSFMLSFHHHITEATIHLIITM